LREAAAGAIAGTAATGGTEPERVSGAGASSPPGAGDVPVNVDDDLEA
jgi:hypothetical protein